MTNWLELKNSLKLDNPATAIDDEFTIELKTGEKVTLVCELVRKGRATFFTKDLLEDTHSMDEGWITGYKAHLSTLDGYLKKLFRLLPDDLQTVIRGGKLRLLREREVFGENRYGELEDCEWLPRYRDAKNRVKRLSGVPFSYWLSTPTARSFMNFCGVDSGGSSGCSSAGGGYGVCFGFDI